MSDTRSDDESKMGAIWIYDLWCKRMNWAMLQYLWHSWPILMALKSLELVPQWYADSQDFEWFKFLEGYHSSR